MIFYFTATGNSKFVADRIAAATNEHTKNIADCMKDGLYSFKLHEGEMLGFVVPVYYYGVPIIVSEFLEKLDVSADHAYYSFAVLNCGSTTGDAGRFFQRAFQVDAVFGIKVVDNYVPLSKVASEAEINERLDNAEHTVGEIVAAINEKKAGKINAVAGFLPSLMTSMFYPIYKRGRKTKKFRVVDDCDGCRTCESVCPRNAIDCSNGMPVWKEPKCEICLACLHKCPVSAIVYGRSAGKGQFINPRVEW